MVERPLTVRDARADELAAVMNVLDGAALEVDAGAVRDRVPGGVLVAVEGDRVLGACVVVPHDVGQPSEAGRDEAASVHVDAVAVRPGRRGQGIGSALVAAAVARWGALSAEFDGRNRPFYDSLGFDVEPIEGGRFRGIRSDAGDEEAHSSDDRR